MQDWDRCPLSAGPQETLSFQFRAERRVVRLVRLQRCCLRRTRMSALKSTPTTPDGIAMMTSVVDAQSRQPNLTERREPSALSLQQEA